MVPHRRGHDAHDAESTESVQIIDFWVTRMYERK
jgi:hypothetical protein